MSDRGSLFLFSLGVILAYLAAAAWLIATGQVAYIDGLFLLICCLTLTMAFSLYVKYLIGLPLSSYSQELVRGGRICDVQHIGQNLLPHLPENYSFAGMAGA